MRLQDKLNAAATAARIEYHWWFILRLRARGHRILDRGEALDSARLMQLSRRIDRHGAIAKRLERHYESQWVAGTARAVLQPQRVHE